MMKGGMFHLQASNSPPAKYPSKMQYVFFTDVVWLRMHLIQKETET